MIIPVGWGTDPNSVAYLKRGVNGWRDMAITRKARIEELEAQIQHCVKKVKVSNAKASRWRKLLIERNREIKRLKEQLAENDCADVIDEYIRNTEANGHDD